MKTALITGITGQDGRHLAELLISKGYSVYGMVNGQRSDLANNVQVELPKLQLVRGDLADTASLTTVLSAIKPDEIYNLGAISFVGLSFSQPELTANITGLGVLRLLEASRMVGIDKSTRIYQASSSEMFGKVQETPQKENTPFYPRSPYGVAKVFAHYACVNYREAYGMHISCGILFNHEGEKRGLEFVTRKITNAVARIRLGLQDELVLGDLNPRRDWGYAGDYVDAMWRMLQQETPGDYVIATGETHSVRDFVEMTFRLAGMEGEMDRYVKSDKKFYRPSEVDLLVGNAEKARTKLGWSPQVGFEGLVGRMLKNDIQIQAKEAGLKIPVELEGTLNKY
jgi:GDPmannose 4,6-dehydratase